MKVSVKPQLAEAKVQKHHYKGYEYWITLEPAKHDSTNETVFLAYVSNNEPDWLNQGSLVKDQNGDVMIANNELVAFANSKEIVQAGIDRL